MALSAERVAKAEQTILKALNRREEMRQKIVRGEVLLCSAQRPMPAKRDQMGQKWYHEDAKKTDLAVPAGAHAIYRCPHCKHEFPVYLKG